LWIGYLCSRGYETFPPFIPPRRPFGTKGYEPRVKTNPIGVSINGFRSGSVSFPLTVQSIPPKKGAAVRPLNCRVKTAVNQSNVENTYFYRYFCRAGTPFSLSRKWPLSDWQKEPVLGLSEIQSFLVWRGIKIGLAFSCLVDQKRNGKKGGFLLFDRAIHTPQKRGCCKASKLQGQKRCKSAQCWKYSF